MKKKIVLSAIILLLVISCFTVSADDFAEPCPSFLLIENETKIFIMTPPNYEQDGYPPTGLYYNTNPPVLIYLVSAPHWANSISYFDSHDVFLSDDGLCFAHLPIPFYVEDRSKQLPDGIAIEFYNKGTLIKQYKALELIKNTSNLRYSTTMVLWEDTGYTPENNYRSKRIYDPDNNTLSVTTIDGIAYTFDITDGSIISAERMSNTGNSFILVIVIALIVLFLLLTVFLILKKKKKQGIKS